MSLDAWPRIVVVGATGAVGREALAILAERGVSADRITALASARSEGRSIPYGSSALTTRPLSVEALRSANLALFMADASTARELAPAAVAAGALVVENSSAFRADVTVPLVIPEVNAGALDAVARPSLVANPNCTTILLLVAIEPLRLRFGIDSVDVVTCQAVSGAGAAAMQELIDQTRAALEGRAEEPTIFHEPCAFNIFSHDSAIDVISGDNEEERKIVHETRRLWSDSNARISPTCLRVAVLRAHTLAVSVTLATEANEHEVRAALADGAGVRLVDDRAGNHFPTPRNAAGGDAVLIGRIRPDDGDLVGGRTRRWRLLAAGDQLRKGAALNAIQIADALSQRL